MIWVMLWMWCYCVVTRLCLSMISVISGWFPGWRSVFLHWSLRDSWDSTSNRLCFVMHFISCLIAFGWQFTDNSTNNALPCKSITSYSRSNLHVLHSSPPLYLHFEMPATHLFLFSLRKDEWLIFIRVAYRSRYLCNFSDIYVGDVIYVRSMKRLNKIS